MARPRINPPSLPLFEEELTAEDAHKIVARIPLGSRLSEEYGGCGGACCKRGASHGPYWYARTPRRDGAGGKRIYVGSLANKVRVERALSIVDSELALAETKAADASGDVPQDIRNLHELRERFGVRKTSVVDVAMAMVGGETRPPK